MSNPLRPVCALCRSSKPVSRSVQIRSLSASVPSIDAAKDVTQSTISSHKIKSGSKTAIEGLRELMDRSPIRDCIVTKQKLPSDYLVPFLPIPENPKRSSQPNQLTLSPKKSSLRTPNPGGGVPNRKGIWVSCRREAVTALTTPGPHLGVLRQSPNLNVPPDIADQAETQLKRRILWELNLLYRRRQGSLTAEAKKRKFASPKKSRPIGHGQILRTLPQIASELEMEKGTEIMAIIDTSPNDCEAANLRDLDARLPVFTLRRLFRNPQLSAVIAALEQAIELELAVPRPPHPDDGSTLVAVQSWRDLGTGGMMGWPLIKALLRLRMFSGEGWVEAGVD